MRTHVESSLNYCEHGRFATEPSSSELSKGRIVPKPRQLFLGAERRGMHRNQKNFGGTWNRRGGSGFPDYTNHEGDFE
jgi:hypothetical protein